MAPNLRYHVPFIFIPLIPHSYSPLVSIYWHKSIIFLTPILTKVGLVGANARAPGVLGDEEAVVFATRQENGLRLLDTRHVDLNGHDDWASGTFPRNILPDTLAGSEIKSLPLSKGNAEEGRAT